MPETSEPARTVDARPVEEIEADPARQAAYEALKDAQAECPICGSDQTDSYFGNVDMEGPTVSQTRQCDDCGATWRDVYTLTGFDALQRKD